MAEISPQYSQKHEEPARPVGNWLAWWGHDHTPLILRGYPCQEVGVETWDEESKVKYRSRSERNQRVISIFVHDLPVWFFHDRTRRASGRSIIMRSPEVTVSIYAYVAYSEHTYATYALVWERGTNEHVCIVTNRHNLSVDYIWYRWAQLRYEHFGRS